MRRHHPIVVSSSTGSLTNALYKIPTVGPSMQNKENMGIVRNTQRDRQQRSQNTSKEHSKRKPIFNMKQNQPKKINQKVLYANSKMSHERVSSADNRMVSSQLIRSQVNRMVESQIINDGKSINPRRKKSVKFSQDSLEVLQKFDPKKSLLNELKMKQAKQTKQLVRNRSNSILKNKFSSASTKDLRLKSNSIAKARQYTQSGNCFSISEYKNTCVRQKYNSLLKYYGRREEKQSIVVSSLSGSMHFGGRQLANKGQYTDNNFMLVPSSIMKNQFNGLNKVKWMRLSELYRDRKLTVLRKNQQESKVVVSKEGQSMANHNFATFINLIKGNRSLLYKIFQNSTYTESGLYMLKIFHSHEWKCIIIDDFIPVIEQGGKMKPFFSNIRQTNNDDELELWPLILEKAYASALGCYQAVHQFNLFGYFCQFMGLPVHKINLANEKKGWKDEVKMIQKDAIVFGFSKLDSKSEEPEPKKIYLPFDKETKDDTVFYEGVKTKSRTRLAFSDLKRVFNELYVIKMASLQHYTSTHFSNPSRFGQHIKNKRCFHDNNHQNTEQTTQKTLEIKRQKPLVKSFKVEVHEEISIILKKRTQINGNGQTKPVWMRMFLFMKEMDGYRWVEGKYASECISFSSVLEPGQYFIVVLPDWTSDNMGELTCILYSRAEPLQIQNCTQSKSQGIIQKGCSDYVQRFGAMMQVNKWICTYAMVDIEAGMMLENINNERRHGKVKVYRSINNLKPNNSYLLPMNDEFYVNGQMKNEIELGMTKEQSYTVVLMLFGGRDDVFLNTFNFGV